MASVDRLAVVATLVLCGIGAFGAYLNSTTSKRTSSGATSSTRCCCSRSAAWRCWWPPRDLIIVFLAIEVLSLSLYVLTALTFRRGPTEAAMKYFLLGAFASAFLLYESR